MECASIKTVESSCKQTYTIYIYLQHNSKNSKNEI